MPPAAPALQTRGLCKDFRGFRAVDSVDLTVADGAVHALVGPNGAGKTTLFNLLTGFLRPSEGRIEVGGRDITGDPPDRVARAGVARSFQITSLFDQLSLRDHVELALASGGGLGWRFWRSDRLLGRHRADALALLDQVGLADRADQPAGQLPYGQKRALELALALALDPKVLLLDEPTRGIDVGAKAEIYHLIEELAAEGHSVVVVSSELPEVIRLADRVLVMRDGTVAAELDRADLSEQAIAAHAIPQSETQGRQGAGAGKAQDHRAGA
jgi:branched-chain amino acid transport system ATP-binding protein